ncbi:MAG TPA: arsenate reductase ArsC, partial [Acetobacteraceae bacterium]|nr:arsenate reductase ArsC [Acetobacteraceae bacterium]
FVFTVCDDAAGEICPVWPGQPVTAHWGVPDPAAATGTEVERMMVFRQVFGMLQHRIQIFASLPFAALDRIALTRRVQEIGQLRESSVQP